jgi:murein tripeptide amidase MpaA
MRIDCDFDGGSIIVLSERPSDARLALRPDTHAEFRQWFYFRVTGVDELTAPIRIVDAARATYPTAWDVYRAWASYDQEYWFRVDVELDGGELSILHEPEEETVFYAYFVPYSLARHATLLDEAAATGRCRRIVLGRSLLGRAITALSFGDPDAELQLWLTARQHPGETMAEWYAEGLIERLLDPDDAVVAAILERAAVHVVPNMNPDGSFLGNLRSNAVGVNPNRTWEAPDPRTSPEVCCVLDAMEQTGVDFFFDIHGDEQFRYCFVVGAEGNPSYSPRMAALERRFVGELLAASPDFQDHFRYDRDRPGEGDLSIGNNQIGERFGCLSLTLEMPFKDLVDDPDTDAWGWTPGRSIQLARDSLVAIAGLLDDLRRGRGGRRGAWSRPRLR